MMLPPRLLALCGCGLVAGWTPLLRAKPLRLRRPGPICRASRRTDEAAGRKNSTTTYGAATNKEQEATSALRLEDQLVFQEDDLLPKGDGGRGDATSRPAAVESAARISATAAWRETEVLTEQLAKLKAKLPRRATWQPEPFELRLGSAARPRDIVRVRIDGRRHLELAVPDSATPNCILIVRGALQVFVPRGSYPGAPLVVPVDGTSIVVAVPPKARAGDRLFVAYPVDVRRMLSAPLTERRSFELLPSPQSAALVVTPLLAPPTTPPLLAPPQPAAHELEQLRRENEALQVELHATRQLLRKMSDLLASQIDDDVDLREALRQKQPRLLLDHPPRPPDDSDEQNE